VTSALLGPPDAATSVGTRIAIDGLSRVFGDGTGLQPTTITLEPGEFVSVLGPSGCGKSTLLRCIAGLETPQAGSLRFDGRVIFDAAAGIDVPARKRRLGMVFQDLALWPHLSAFENVAFPLRVAREQSIAEKVDRALALVGLTSFREKMPHQLSGGQQQRVAVARALVARPDVLLMDEPFSALDAALKVQLREELSDLVRTLGVTTIFVTHDQEEAMSISDRIVVLESGSVRQAASPQEVYETPADLFVANFIGTFNALPLGPVATTVRVGVRPERVREGSEPGRIHIEATVLSSTYRGGSHHVRATVAGVDTPWSFPSFHPHSTGEKVTLSVHADDLISLP